MTGMKNPPHFIVDPKRIVKILERVMPIATRKQTTGDYRSGKQNDSKEGCFVGLSGFSELIHNLVSILFGILLAVASSIVNPNGIPPSSPGLLGTSYPGKPSKNIRQL
jgi:hypothetical protein